MRITVPVRDDHAARLVLEGHGLAVHEPFAGWLCVDRTGMARGACGIFSSQDGEDVEMVMHGGWSLSGARALFREVFGRLGHERISARCLASNIRNIRVLERIGFRQEGRKRLRDGDHIHFGMFREECRLLPKGA